MTKKLQLISLGCNKNLIDSEIMLGRLKTYDLTDDTSKADLIIVNTCGFINAAKEESLQTIFTLHEKRKKDSLLVVSGCLIERYKDELTKELKEVDLFTGVGNFHEIDEIIKLRKNRFSKSVYVQQNEERVIANSNFHAYIKLGEGCNQKCSFCAIPGFKGKLQSRPLNDIINEVKTLTKRGYYDFSFISQDSSSYLKDKGEKNALLKLIDAIEKIDGVKSARILYLYPTTLSDEIIKKITSSKIFHSYFDMPIQHTTDKMLKLMKRGSGIKTIKHQFDLMRKDPDAFLRTSIIVGHPKESEEDFNAVCEFFKDNLIDRVSIFAYSDEEDTAAYEMEEKVSNIVMTKRIEILEKIVAQNRQKSLEKNLNKHILAVIEGQSSEGEMFLGAKKLDWAPEIDGEILINDTGDFVPKIGNIYEVFITQIAGDKLVGEITKEIC